MGVSRGGIDGTREFPTTSWSVILTVRDPAHPDYARHLERLISLYWQPVCCAIRHARRCSPEDAKDLTQAFFADVVLDRALVTTYRRERGSFRSLLRAAVSNYLQDETRTRHRQKRGGGAVPLSLDAFGAAPPLELAGSQGASPEMFDLAWNEMVMSLALARLEERLTGEDRRLAFEVFRRYDVEGEAETLSYEDLGRQLGLTAAQVRRALILARASFREVVTDVVRVYVDEPADLAAELRRLLGG